MREILHRGKRTDNGEWAEGDLYRKTDALGEKETIIFQDKGADAFKKNIVDPKTVGQYTGKKDKNKKKIFEWDIVKIHDKDGSDLLAVVKFGEYNSPSLPDNLGGHIGFYLEFHKYNDILRKDILYWLKNEDIEVVGNIFDSPELIA